MNKMQWTDVPQSLEIVAFRRRHGEILPAVALQQTNFSEGTRRRAMWGWLAGPDRYGIWRSARLPAGRFHLCGRKIVARFSSDFV